MTLNKREQMYAWGVGGAVAVLVFYMVIMSLFISPWEDYNTKIQAAQKKLNDGKAVLETAKKDNAQWTSLSIARDETGAANMAQRVEATIRELARRRLNNLTWNAAGSQVIQHTDYMEIKFNAHATTNMAGIAQFLQLVEAPGQLFRLDDLQMDSQKPGLDELNVELKLSALVYVTPKDIAKAGAATQRALGRSGAAGRGTTTAAAKTTGASAAELSTEEKIAAMMAARRQAEEKQANGEPATTSAPASAPAPVSTAPASMPATSPATVPSGGVR